jgi:hypothetical protein
VRHHLSNPQAFLPQGDTLGERTKLGMAPGKVGAGEHGGEGELTEAFVAPCPLEGRHGLPEAVDRPMIVALGLVGCAEIVVRQQVQDNLPAGHGERQGALSGGNGLVIHAHAVEIV